MSKLIRKLGKALNTRSKDTKSESNDSAELQVDAVPTGKAVIAKTSTTSDQDEILESQELPTTPGGHQQQPMNQANLFNSPNQTVYQFNHASGIHIGNNLTINQNITQDPVQNKSGDEDDADCKDDMAAGTSKDHRLPTDSSKALRKKYPKTRTIELLLKSNEDIDHFAMDIIATHLGQDWRSVARDLGFSQGEIDQFYEDNFAFGIKEVIYKILSEWSQREEEPHLGRVVTVLWNRDIHREVVYRLKLGFKKRQS